MLCVACLTVTFLDRFVLSGSRYIVMASQAEYAVKCLQINGRAFNLVTIVAVAAAYRRVDYLSKESRVTGTMLRMAIDAPGFNRVPLMGRN
jgi:hypothetical protein